ncbi:MAG: MAPEG family protein [Sphingomonadaceae bacterium]|nr:MAPEG family protein [Sphingomonadaceae bacterium]
MSGFSRTQAGVAAGMAVGLAATIAAFAWPRLPAVPGAAEARLTLWFAASISAGLWLLIGIALLARHRFFSPADIQGGGLSEGTPGAKLLQSLIQNTLEQLALAVPVWGGWLWLAPEEWRGLVLLCAAMFGLGRLLFFLCYRFGAPARALGFTLTFYPTVGLYLFLLPRTFAILLG